MFLGKIESDIVEPKGSFYFARELSFYQKILIKLSEK
jgi:hypothetical protein